MIHWPMYSSQQYLDIGLFLCPHSLTISAKLFIHMGVLLVIELLMKSEVESH